MKFKPTKLLPVRQVYFAAGVLFVLTGLNSCKMPAPASYAQADWSVQTSVTKEDYPVGVTLEDISDEPLPPEDEIARGLPNHSGAAKATDPWATGALKTDSQGRVAELPLKQEILAPGAANEPPMPGTEAADARYGRIRLKDTLVGRDEPNLPEPNPAAPPEEARPAKVNSTPENLALMAAASVRPYLAPRGAAVPEAQPAGSPNFNTAIPAAPTPPSASVANVAPAVSRSAASAPATDDLVEILKLAKKVEASHKR